MVTYERVIAAAQASGQTLDQYFSGAYRNHGGILFNITAEKALSEFRIWGSIAAPWLAKAVIETETHPPLPLFA